MPCMLMNMGVQSTNFEFLRGSGEPATYPMQHAYARRMIEIHTQNLINRGAVDAGDLIAYLADQAIAVLRDAAAYQSDLTG